jgi:hypothetical protein
MLNLFKRYRPEELAEINIKKKEAQKQRQVEREVKYIRNKIGCRIKDWVGAELIISFEDYYLEESIMVALSSYNINGWNFTYKKEKKFPWNTLEWKIIIRRESIQ